MNKLKKIYGLGRSFWGRLWRRAAASIAGMLIGGPIGAIVAGYLYEKLMFQPESDAGGLNAATLPTELPLSAEEEIYFNKWIDFNFSPTIAYLSNKIDSEITVGLNGGLNAISQTRTNLAIQKVNEVLLAISTFRAYNNQLIATGESISFESEALRSENYSKNKQALIKYYIDLLEKPILEYVEQNLKSLNNLKLVSGNFIASDSDKVVKCELYWLNTVVSEYKKYITEEVFFKDPIKTEITVTNVNLESDEPTTDGVGEQVAIVPKDKSIDPYIEIDDVSDLTPDESDVILSVKPKNYIKRAAIAVLSLIALRKLFK